MTENPRTNVQLADFQARFVQEFLQPGAAPFHLLSGPVGAGKTFTAAALASKVLESGEARRVLVLSPAPLAGAWRENLYHVGQTEDVSVVDGQLYRELESRVPTGGNPWPDGTVVLSQDTAKRKDIAKSLARVHWNLVVFDEAHRLTGQRRELMERLIQSGNVERLLLVAGTPDVGHYANLIPDLVVTDWATEVQHWREAHTPQAVVLKEPPVLFRRTADEVAFLEALHEVTGGLPHDPQGRFLQQLLLSAASSSIFTVEQALLRTLRRLEDQEKKGTYPAQAGLGIEAVTEAEVDWSEEEPTSLPWHTVPEAQLKLGRLVDLIAAVGNDAKFCTLEVLLADLMASSEGLHVCIFTDFAATADYLSMNLGEGLSGCFAVTGVMAADHCIEQIRKFEDGGGVLIGTTAALQGVALAFVEAVIHYDLPRSAPAMDWRIGRVNRVGRTRPCRMYVLRDDSGVLPHEKELLRSYGWT